MIMKINIPLLLGGSCLAVLGWLFFAAFSGYRLIGMPLIISGCGLMFEALGEDDNGMREKASRQTNDDALVRASGEAKLSARRKTALALRQEGQAHAPPRRKFSRALSGCLISV
jgi:hypothetical protein